MLSVNKSRPVRGGGCARCRVIRLFVLAAFLMLILGLVAGERLETLQLVTPARVAAAIWIAGGLLFISKLGFWLASRRRAEPDHEPVSLPASGSEKTGQS